MPFILNGIYYAKEFRATLLFSTEFMSLFCNPIHRFNSFILTFVHDNTHTHTHKSTFADTQTHARPPSVCRCRAQTQRNAVDYNRRQWWRWWRWRWIFAFGVIRLFQCVCVCVCVCVQSRIGIFCFGDGSLRENRSSSSCVVRRWMGTSPFVGSSGGD